MMLYQRASSTFTQVKRYIGLYLAERSFMIAWILVNFGIFGYNYFKFRFNPAYHYTHQIIGHGLFISRGTASVLNFSSFIIFIPMCRTLLTSLRSLTTPTVPIDPVSSPSFETSETASTISKATTATAIVKVWSVLTKFIVRFIVNPINGLLVSLIDRCQQIHIAAAYTICASGLVHSIAHIINTSMASVNYNHRYPTINLAAFPGQHPIHIISGSVAGITGIAMNLVLIIILLTSSSTIRRDHFNLFKYTHFLTFIFVGLILCHPLGGLLKEQTNLDQHVIGCDDDHQSSKSATVSAINTTADYQLMTKSMTIDRYNGSMVISNNHTLNNNINTTSSFTRCDPPIFKPLNSCTWIWLSISLTIYTLDVILRLWRRRTSVTLINSSISEAHIVNLELAQVKGAQSIIKNSLPGQFVYLKCPSISALEWHPFSISSIPVIGVNETFNLNIKLNGDWTDKLVDAINEETNGQSSISTIDKTSTNCTKKRRRKKFKLYVDGPFSSPLQDLLKHKICVCIAGGIGVTPFISFLSLFRSYPAMLNAKSVKIERLYFIWICRNVSNLSGFIDTLAHVYAHHAGANSQSIKADSPHRQHHSHQLNNSTQRSPLRLTIYLTQETQETMAVNVNRLGVHQEMLINKLLRNSIFLGKPKLRTIFQQLHRNYQQQKVSVFYSGPSGLRREIKKTCHSINLTGSRFVFKHEDFGS